MVPQQTEMVHKQTERYTNGATTASVYSRLGPSYAPCVRATLPVIIIILWKLPFPSQYNLYDFWTFQAIYHLQFVGYTTLVLATLQLFA